jgi:threonine aldolase
MELIDLRSDTVTRPGPAMREAMARAEVGDDVFGEDPTAVRLEAMVAELIGKEAALFVSSGTMGNQLAINTQTQPGEEIIVGEGAHCAWYESGAAAAVSGVQAVAVGQGGLFTAAEMEAAVKPQADWYPRTRLVALENTHNRAGGLIWPQPQLESVTRRARELGLKLHLDGARLWNAATATGLAPRAIAAPFDSVSVCFSKGLGAPVGSALCGSRELVARARRARKMLGGGMRQIGIIAAGALYALEHHRERLAEDHENAAAIARDLAAEPGVRVDVARVQTNIVMVDVPGVPAAKVIDVARTAGVLVSGFGPERLRVVTHLDVAKTAREGGRRLAQAIRSARG